MSLLYVIGLPILAAFLTPFYSQHLRGVSVLVSGTLVAILLTFYGAVPMREAVGFDTPLGIAFVLDRASFLFAMLCAGGMLVFAIYRLNAANSAPMFVLTNLLMAGILGLVLSADIFNLYIFFEIASIAAYILTSFHRDRPAYAGAIKYMIVGAVASIFILLAIMLLYLNLGYLTLARIGTDFHTLDGSVQHLVLVLLFIGFGIKAEIFPLNFWVADIYQAAPTSIGSLFSATLSKAYLFVFFRLLYRFHVDAASLTFLAGIGLTGFAVAELAAFNSRHIKRMFAYSTMGQIGVLFVALASDNITVIAGGLFLVVAHTVTKLMLFLAWDRIEQILQRNTTEAFAHFRSPFLLALFVVGFLSILGIPPFAGFIAKLTILKGLAQMGSYGIVGAILIISLVEAAYFFRLLSQHLRSDVTQEVSVSPLHKLLLGSLALSLLYFGLFPQELLDMCTGAARTLMQGGFHV